MTKNKNLYTDEKFIESFKYLTSLTSDPTAMVKSVCKTNILTETFLKEYSSYINKTDFTLSYKLSAELCETYSELFDEQLLIDSIKDYIKNEESESTNISNTMTSIPSLFAAAGLQQSTVVMRNSEASDNNTKKKDPTTLSLSLYAKYADILDPILSNNNTDNPGLNEIILKLIRNASKNELENSDIALTFIGRYSDDVDNILLKRISDSEIRDAIILLLSSRDGSNMTSEAYKYLSLESKENLLSGDYVDPEIFINTLSDAKDLGWINTMLQRVKNNEITLNPTTKQLDTQLLKLLSVVSEDTCSIIFEIGQKYFPNAFSYKLMGWLLNNKAFDESHLITGKDLFVKAGLKINLKNIAKQNDYKKLMNIL